MSFIITYGIKNDIFYDEIDIIFTFFYSLKVGLLTDIRIWMIASFRSILAEK